MKALEVLNPNGIFLYGGQTISEAADLLLARNISAAPVLNNQGRCIGVVGKDLLLTALLEGRTAETDICQIMQGSFQRMPAEEEFTLENNELSEFILVEKEGLPLGLIDFLYLSETIVPDKSQKMFEFYAFVDAVYTPVMAIDNAGRITIINKWMTRLLDLKQEDVLNVLAAEIIGENIILKLLQGQGINADERVNLKGRNFIPFCNDVIVNNETIGRVLLLRDISEVEELMNESEYTRGLNRQLQAVIEFSYDGLYVTDGQANTLLLNKGFEGIMGVNAEECVGTNMAQLVEEGVFSRSGTLTAIEKGGSVTLSLTSSTGKEALVTSNPIYDDDGKVILYVTNVRDITELNELERKLERVEGLREREMEAVIESMFDGLYVTDGMANTLRINQGFERIMGIKAVQCVGKNMKDLVAEGVFSRSGTLVALETGTRATISLTSSTGKEA
ncbi:MAG: PAS domain S-box protein, partial [Actinobacteria bacterium]|nr:PAS domain S-box protein [Actinomycetota bacterium]